MFTGIIQEVGEIRERIPAGKSMRFSLKAPWMAERLQVGDSVACDGACLTVEKVDPMGFSVCAVPETLSKTTLSFWKGGDPVNLEAALTIQTPMGGHFVLGHVDGVCEVTAVKPTGGEGVELTVQLPAEFLPYCVYKGSLTLSGVSLTVAAVQGDSLRLALIPHTLEATNLSRARAGSRLNFEMDILAKYVERQLGTRGAVVSDPRASGATPLSLENWGYGIP